MQQHHHHHLKRQAASAPIPPRQIYTQRSHLLRRGVVDRPCQPSQFEPFIVSKVWTASSYLTKRATFLSTLCPWPCPKISRADDMCDCLILMCSLQDFLSQELRYGFHKHCSIRSTRIPSCRRFGISSKGREPLTSKGRANLSAKLKDVFVSPECWGAHPRKDVVIVHNSLLVTCISDLHFSRANFKQ